jgi:hypothetical protein
MGPSVSRLAAFLHTGAEAAGCKADQSWGSMAQSIAAWCVVPGQTGLSCGAADTIASEDDVLTRNCWDACWDENAAIRISQSPPTRSSGEE